MNINLTLIAQAVSFAILIWFTVKFVWPPLLTAIETRQKEIADGLAAGERGRDELEQAAKGSAKVEGDRIVASAKAEVEQEVNRAKEGLRNQVATLAIAGAEKILRKEIDAKAHEDILNAIAKEL